MKRSYLRRKPHPINKESFDIIPTLKRKLWRLISAHVRERDNWTCITCSKVARGEEDRAFFDAGHYKIDTGTEI